MRITVGLLSTESIVEGWIDCAAGRTRVISIAYHTLPEVAMWPEIEKLKSVLIEQPNDGVCRRQAGR